MTVAAIFDGGVRKKKVEGKGPRKKKKKKGIRLS